jgi:hypothetical protein
MRQAVEVVLDEFHGPDPFPGRRSP